MTERHIWLIAADFVEEVAKHYPDANEDQLRQRCFDVVTTGLYLMRPWKDRLASRARVVGE